MNLKLKIKKLYSSKEYFVKIRRNYKSKVNYWPKVKKDPDGKTRFRFSKTERLNFKKNNLSIIKKINKLKGSSVLDVGCGNGNMLSYLSKKFKKFGIEIDKKAIKNSKKYGAIFEKDLNKKIILPEKYDIIIIYHVIEHIEEPVIFFKNILNYLKKGGYLVLGTPDFDCAMARRYGNKFRMLHDKTHISLFTYESLCRLFRFMKLKILEVDFPYFETTYFNKQEINRLFSKNKTMVSPPFYGNVVNFILKK